MFFIVSWVHCKPLSFREIISVICNLVGWFNALNVGRTTQKPIADYSEFTQKGGLEAWNHNFDPRRRERHLACIAR